MKKFLLSLIVSLAFSGSSFAADVDTNQRSCTCTYDTDVAGCTITNPPKRSLDYLILYKLPYAIDGKNLRMAPSVFIRYCSNINADPLRYFWNFKDGKTYLTMTY